MEHAADEAHRTALRESKEAAEAQKRAEEAAAERSSILLHEAATAAMHDAERKMMAVIEFETLANKSARERLVAQAKAEKERLAAEKAEQKHKAAEERAATAAAARQRAAEEKAEAEAAHRAAAERKAQAEKDAAARKKREKEQAAAAAKAEAEVAAAKVAEAVAAAESQAKAVAEKRAVNSAAQAGGAAAPVPIVEHSVASHIVDAHHEGEMGARLKKAGAHVGRLTCSLMWHNHDDLDLHCETPAGEHICWHDKKADKCDGHLDVDMNASEKHMTNTPIENMYVSFQPVRASKHNHGS